MRVSDNTILITGGTSGIGLELAARLLALGNTVIVTGRSQSGIDAARKKLAGLHAIQSDVSDPADIAKLYERVNEFPAPSQPNAVLACSHQALILILKLMET